MLIFPTKPILGDLGCDYCLHQRPELGVRDCHGSVGLRCRCLDVWQRSNHPHPTGDPSDSRGASGEDCTIHQSPEAGKKNGFESDFLWKLVWPNLWISWISGPFKYFFIFCWFVLAFLVGGPSESLEVVSSLDLWDFEGAHVVSPIVNDAGLKGECWEIWNPTDQRLIKNHWSVSVQQGFPIVDGETSWFPVTKTSLPQTQKRYG